MKVLMVLIAVACLTTLQNVYGGQLVYKTMYVPQTIVQGDGESHEQAQVDANSAIPAGYIADPRNSAVWECTESNAYFAETGIEACDTSVGNNKYRVTIPLIKK